MTQPDRDDPERPYFATAAKGTEGLLRDELKELRLPKVKATRGGVYFGGDFAAAARACLHSRIAIRVLARETSFPARDEGALYAGVRQVAWERVLDLHRTLAVEASVRSAAVTNSAFVAQRVKDAIVDRMRHRFGARPDVDKRDPDVQVAVHWAGEQVTVSLDVSGTSLHARGYRTQAGTAPLRETLAAAMVRLSGWDRALPLCDPMCGSGTIAIEAAQWALGIAPGLARARFGFERWASHGPSEQRMVRELREAARAAVRPASEGPVIEGFDSDESVLALARANAKRAGVEIGFERSDVRSLQKRHERALVITNPPYGERLPQDRALAAELAARFKTLSGYRCCVLAHDRTLAQAMKRKPAIEHALWNGPLECRFLAWDIG